MASLLKHSEWSAQDKAEVLAAFRRHYTESLVAGHPYAQHVDFVHGWAQIESGAVGTVLVDGYLVVYDVGPTWFCPKPVFTELMVLRVADRPGYLRHVITAMEELARAHGCVGIATGDAMGSAVAHAYKRAGYTPVVSQFYKEL
jgi:GNAT superfamily N-acetyltransferase